MKRKFLTFLLALGCVFSLGAITACGNFGNAANSGSSVEQNVFTMQTAYMKAQELGYEGSLEEFIQSISGKDGEAGKDGVGIANISVNQTGELVVVFSNGITVNLGSIKGQDGKDGVGVKSVEIIDNELVFTLSDGSVINLGNVVGADGQDGENGSNGESGKDGVGISSVQINDDGTATVYYTNGMSENIGKIVGEKGDVGDTGATGVGISAASIVDGNLIITFADNTSINCGKVVGEDGKDGVDGEDGKDGVSEFCVKSIKRTDSGELMITFTDGKTQTIFLGACFHENKTFKVVSGKTKPDYIDDAVWNESKYYCYGISVCDDCGAAEFDYSETNHVLISSVPDCVNGGSAECVFCDFKVEMTEPPLGHSLTTKWSMEEGETLCQDGGYAITYCTRCNWIDTPVVVGPIGHHSAKWTMVLSPELNKTGLVQGICDGCDLVVNDEKYSGCGQFVEMELPSLNSGYYTITNINQPDCSEPGTATYEMTVDGQIFAFNADLPAKHHSIITSDGGAEQLPAGAAIYADDEKYLGAWQLIAEEEIGCEEGAQGYFVCADCGKRVSIYVMAKHEMPTDTSQITFTPGDNGGMDIVAYECARCKQFVQAEMEHNYRRTLMITGNNQFEVETICTNSFNGVDCAYMQIAVVTNVTMISVKEPTCVEKGRIEYEYIAPDGESIRLFVSTAQTGHTIGDYEFFAGQRIDIDIANDLGFVTLDTGASTPICMGIVGVGTCEMCGNEIGVVLYREHTPDDGMILPTCEKDGEYKCADCGELVTVPALGHNIKSTIASEDSETYTIMEECQRADCGYSVERSVEKSCCQVELIEGASCANEGTLLIYIYADKSLTSLDCIVESKLPKTWHTLTYKGVPTAIDVNEVYEYDANMMLIVDGGADNILSCDSGDSVMAIFACEVCGLDTCGIRVRMAHTKPTDENLILRIEPDCIADGYDEWDCEVCGELCRDYIIPALGGHDLVYNFDHFSPPSYDIEGYIEVHCTRCDFMDFIQLPTLSNDCYLLNKMEEVCEQHKLVSCLLSAEKVIELGLSTDIWIAQINELKFVVDVGNGLYVPHIQEGAPIIWTDAIVEVKNGETWLYTYENTGYYCPRCDKVMIVNKYLISQELISE